MVRGEPMNAATAMPGSEQAWNLLGTVMDPEIPNLSLIDIGVIREVETGEDGSVRVAMSPTYTGCPATDMMKIMVHDALISGGFARVQVDTVLSPAWSSDWITEEGHRKLREAGIAPPAARSSDKRHLMGLDPDVPCPQCGSMDTELKSNFGSTACKALYQCRSCHEPFDYFKCI